MTYNGGVLAAGVTPEAVGFAARRQRFEPLRELRRQERRV